eukprot:CAMPEP_0183716140 /NCGR_PEP_ID=MMETSP0737-20130205/10145_1 /TAXON_ID=385413 /ORGANISM="Thalassiosira miniscula, Strain CCMP1093" /LENGTH=502 /DNA_ID=CAMNT_0025945357 /DNA_START=275 /DNA_END=1783 /DNA_ORIENTATION=+
MSLHNLHRRSSPPQRSTQETEKKQNRRSQLRKQKYKSTRRGRIWDLLRHIPTFAIRALRLLAFVVCLLPAFIVFVWHYMTCDRIAVYYGGSRLYSAEEKNEHDNDKDSVSSGKTLVSTDGEKVDDSNGASNGEKSYNRNDPFFSRHYLDIYGSKTPSPEQMNIDEAANKKPVVIFLTGGAWIIGYKMWGTLLARALAPFGIICIVPDYRNFPRVNIEGMVQDVDMSIQWVVDHVEEYGGDKDRVVLVGQSAGAHIGGVVVAMKAWDWLRKEMSARESTADFPIPHLKSTYTPRQICGFISTSSPDNLVTMRPVFHHHGLSASVQNSIFGGAPSDDRNCTAREEEDVFEKWSPYHLILKSQMEYAKLLELDDGNRGDGIELKDAFPRFCVIHGTADKTVPLSEAKEFILLLSKLQIPTEVKVYKEWSHTDPILEAPMCGDHTYHRDIYDLVCVWTASNSFSNINGLRSNGVNRSITKFDESHTLLKPICPSVLVDAARFCNPF